MNHKAVIRIFALWLCVVRILNARDINPVLLSTVRPPTGGATMDVAVSSNFVFAAEGEKGLLILDVSNPSNPQQVGSVDTPGLATAVVVSGDIALIADGMAGLQIIDVSNRTAPRIVSEYDTPGE